MYRLLIVEDEEFLRKSLCAMVDWESAGIQIAGRRRKRQGSTPLSKRKRADRFCLYRYPHAGDGWTGTGR